MDAIEPAPVESISAAASTAVENVDGEIQNVEIDSTPTAATSSEDQQPAEEPTPSATNIEQVNSSSPLPPITKAPSGNQLASTAKEPEVVVASPLQKVLPPIKSGPKISPKNIRHTAHQQAHESLRTDPAFRALLRQQKANAQNIHALSGYSLEESKLQTEAYDAMFNRKSKNLKGNFDISPEVW